MERTLVLLKPDAVVMARRSTFITKRKPFDEVLQIFH